MNQVVVVKLFVQVSSKVLLVKSNSTDDDLLYELPGGNVEFGESIVQALSRSTKKQLGKVFEKYELQTNFAFVKNGVHIIGQSYYAQLDKEFATKPEFAAKWVDIAGLDKVNLSEVSRAVANELRVIDVTDTTSPTDVDLYTDGGSRGNPGPSALGYVIYDKDETVVKKNSKYLGITTNNQAEYQAVKYGLQDCLSVGAKRVSVYLDSQLVVNQMNGVYKIKNRDLWPIHESIKSLTLKFSKGVKFTYVPREFNKEADAMVNYALDEERKNEND